MDDGSTAAKAKEPFRFRADELLSPSRLAPEVQQLLATRERATQALAVQCELAVLAVAKLLPTLPRVGVVGGGRVGCAVLLRLLAIGYPPSLVALATRQPERPLPAPLELVERGGDTTRLAREADVVVLCVPPPQLKGVALQVQFAAAERAERPLVVVSTLCGVPRERVAKACGTPAVVRARANMATLEQAGMEPVEAERARASALRYVDAAFVLPALEVLAGRSAGVDPTDKSARERVAALLTSAAAEGADDSGRELWPHEWEQQLAMLASPGP